MHFDGDGLIVHRGPNGEIDGGDTAQREGWYWFGTWIREHVLNDPWTKPRALSFEQVLDLLEPAKDGVFHRHPKLPPWNDPHSGDLGFSRDQMVPLVAAMGVRNLNDPLRRLWNALPQDPLGGTKHSFNGEWKTAFGQKLFHTGDVIGPQYINLFRRAWNEDPMPAGDGNGPFGEAELVASAMGRTPPAVSDPDDTGPCLNLIVALLLMLLRFPTDNAKTAANYYAHNRVVSYGSFLGPYRQKYGVDMGVSPPAMVQRIKDGMAEGWLPDSSRVLGAVRWYHRAETGANPELAEIYEPIIRTYLE